MPSVFGKFVFNGQKITIPDGALVRFVTPVGALRTQINDVNQLGQGGRVALVADNSGEDDSLSEDFKITGVSLILNFRKDNPMRDYPEPANDGGKRYSIILIEHTPPA